MKICHEIMPPVKNDRNEETFQRAFEQMINKKNYRFHHTVYVFTKFKKLPFVLCFSYKKHFEDFRTTLYY